MRNPKSKSKHQTSIPGFTIVECLLGLAISAVLLTAVAAAFNASVVSYGENQDMYWTMNNARQALVRMTSQLRTGDSVLPSAPSYQCSFFTADGNDVTYEWRSNESKLYVCMNGLNQEYLLCDHVVAASFTKIPTNDGPPPTDCRAVQISLTVQSGDFRRTLAAAAVIRRNL
ncbi:MAG: prepilin-type N-terminal cleavage/methylation domain-containing protein [Planctomycetes bacterium]|jgi:prepilin-type N-terminal cleavage/methylation domain-containing protein|nr:prepilin-type N-terminal cleavage/methylation domain-containing protein [Planctomycetota bacterium]